MTFNKHINEVIKKFFLLTDVPVISFKLNGNEISSVGYNDKLEKMLYTYNIYEKMMKEVSNNKENTTFTIPGQKNIYYIGCSICPKNFYKGVFILGPCSTIKSNDANIPFKPLKIKQYLIHILRIIWKEYKNEIGMTFTEFLNKIRIEKKVKNYY